MDHHENVASFGPVTVQRVIRNVAGPYASEAAAADCSVCGQHWAGPSVERLSAQARDHAEAQPALAFDAAAHLNLADLDKLRDYVVARLRGQSGPASIG